MGINPIQSCKSQSYFVPTRSKLSTYHISSMFWLKEAPRYVGLMSNQREATIRHSGGCHTPESCYEIGAHWLKDPPISERLLSGIRVNDTRPKPLQNYRSLAENFRGTEGRSRKKLEVGVRVGDL